VILTLLVGAAIPLEYPIERAVILGAAKRQHFIAVGLIPPGSRALEAHMTQAFVRRFDPPTAQRIAAAAPCRAPPHVQEPGSASHY
jgi:hypothetical protein